jgi:hypothetical protein
VLPRQLRDKSFVLVGLISAQFVIHVRHRQHDAQLDPQFQQQTKQGHGIRSTGNRHRQAVSGPNRIVFPNCSQQPLNQFGHEEMVQQEGSCQLPVVSYQWKRFAERLEPVAGYW